MPFIKNIYQTIFLYSINTSYILYFIVLFGIGGYAPQYLEYLRVFLKVYIALLLIFTPLMLEAFQPQSQLNYTTKTLPDHLGLWQLTAPPPTT